MSIEEIFSAGYNTPARYISCIQFYWWRKLVDPEKTTDLSQVT